MSSILQRGCTYKIETNAAVDVGGVAMSNPPPLLLQGLGVEEAEILQKSVTLSGTRLLYAFGSDFGTLAVHGLLVAPLGHTVNDLIAWYDSVKLSNATGGVINVSDAKSGGGLRMIVTGLKLGNPDPEFGIAEVVVFGVRQTASAKGQK
jgi:hypothetical protein